MTRILFRADKTGSFINSITAIFVDEVFTNSRPSSRMSYAHIGQHGECCLEWVRLATRPAKKEEYTPLLRELENLIGYKDLEILNRLPRGV